MTELFDGPAFVTRIRRARRRVLRLEHLQEYRDSGEDEWIAAFERGDRTPPPNPEQDRWEEMLRGMTAAGVLISRVHVVREPLTAYLVFEICWMYPPSANAGEKIRIAVITDVWPAGVPILDFWIIDDDVYRAVYTGTGSWLGVYWWGTVTDIPQAEGWWDCAIAASIPLDDYLLARPELNERAAA